MHATYKAVRNIGVLSAMFCLGCGSEAPQTQSGSAVAPPKSDVYTLDVVVNSPIAIVQYKDGTIDALFPNVDDHPYGYVKGLNDCGMEEGNGEDYSLDFSTSNSSTSIDPNNNMPTEVRVDNNTEHVNIDPLKHRYTKLSLPVPREIVPIHLDDEGLSVHKKGATPPAGHLYPTQIALRYTVAANTDISLVSGTSHGTCGVKVEHLDKEMIVAVGLGPAVNDDLQHTHAKKAFTAEVALLPDLDREIGYPKIVMEGKQRPRHRTSDCQAPMILVTNADSSRLKK